MMITRIGSILGALLLILASRAKGAEFIKVDKDNSFAFAESGNKFTPWGFNYDHDRDGRLLEAYWEKEWETVAQDFEEMKALGANVVRIHLQVGRFMISAEQANEASLATLRKLLGLAERIGLYLDITGLGCYEKKGVPEWYDALDEGERWDVQARFWEAVARTCRSSAAVFCYDLMNEPVVTEDKSGTREWTPGPPLGGMYFVQRLTLNPGQRTQKEVAEAWVAKMTAAIRKHDARRLITVGVIPWAHTWPNAKPLFYSPEVGKHLDFASVHFYPKAGEVEKALKALAVYDVGKPLVIEEMFPLSCGIQEFDQFIEGSRQIADGWIGFYWGKTIKEYEAGERDIGAEMTLQWLRWFREKGEKSQAKP